MTSPMPSGHLPGWPERRLTLTAAGAADPATAWRRYLVPAAWPTWAPHLARVEASTPEIEPGTTGVVVARGGLRARFRVIAVDRPAMRWSWTVRVGPLSLELGHAIAPAANGGSVTTLDVTGPAGVVDAYAPLAWWALRRLVTEP